MTDPRPKHRRVFRLPWRTRQQVVAVIDEELEFHLQMRTRELIDAGVDPADARAEAERQFGDVGFTKRYMRSADMGLDRKQRLAEQFGELRQDIRYGVRTLTKNPG